VISRVADDTNEALKLAVDAGEHDRAALFVALAVVRDEHLKGGDR
jgi:hypothetical protein